MGLDSSFIAIEVLEPEQVLENMLIGNPHSQLEHEVGYFRNWHELHDWAAEQWWTLNNTDDSFNQEYLELSAEQLDELEQLIKSGSLDPVINNSTVFGSLNNPMNFNTRQQREEFMDNLRERNQACLDTIAKCRDYLKDDCHIIFTSWF